MPQKLTVLDLFSGIGGFSLGLERTGGFRTIAFCEIEPYCQRVLKKHWPDVPIYSDIRNLAAGRFEQQPDLICGGFPCQDISVAGKGVGLSGERSGLWFEMLRVIRELRPTWLLIENVPNLRTKGADIVFAGLEEADYAWTSAVVGAWAVGAPHKRNRVWILGNAKHDGSFATAVARGVSETVCDYAQGANGSKQSQGAGSSTVLADSLGTGLQGWPLLSECSSEQFVGSCGMGDSASAGFPDWAGSEVGQPSTLTQFERPSGREVELSFRGVAYGVSNRVHRLRALGNSVVPQIPELFGRFILQIEGTG